jgi:peptide/nickel transport system ATP-binding protein/glutathione transport system ATP-binding protein
MKDVSIAAPANRKSERDLNFKPIPSPIHKTRYVPKPSVYDEVDPGAFSFNDG